MSDIDNGNSASSAIYVLAASIFSLFVAFIKHHYGLRLRSACCTKECDLEMSVPKSPQNNKHELLKTTNDLTDGESEAKSTL